MPIARALISASDKTGLREFAKGLAELGIAILSTGGTAQFLRENGIAAIDVSAHTGSPEILDGRVKTLHPKIHGGILAMRDDAGHQKEMEENGISPIDMVVVNLYPFEATVAKEGCTLAEAIENIDIGGPSMIRSAAKNHKYVAVVTDPADYGAVLDELKRSREISGEARARLAKKAFALTAMYDGAIAAYLDGASCKSAGDDFPPRLILRAEKICDLRYGENPHQKAAFYRFAEKGEADIPRITDAEKLQGKELSYNNIVDADSALDMVAEFADRIFAVVIKHTNPCGAAVSERTIAEALEKAVAADPVSAFGGIIGLSRRVNAETARLIAESFYEVVFAPDFSSDALNILAKKKNLRLLRCALPPPSKGNDQKRRARRIVRQIAGGFLVQDGDAAAADVRACRVATNRAPTDAEYAALDLGWRICKYVKSNAIVFSSADRLLGIGAGQMNRVASVRLAAANLHSGQCPITMASDAFFPFRDGIDEAAKAGVTAVIQPGGSVRDEEVIGAANEHNMAMVFTGIRHFRH